jgi:hypothetical protein
MRSVPPWQEFRTFRRGAVLTQVLVKELDNSGACVSSGRLVIAQAKCELEELKHGAVVVVHESVSSARVFLHVAGDAELA